MNKKNGFTMIEVILVLAIAGVIITAAFIALPNLWASERDSARRENVMKFVTQLKNFQTNNNRGALPGSTGYDKAKIESNASIEVDGHNAISSRGDTTDPTSWFGFYRDFFDDSFTDPDGEYMNLIVAKCGVKNKIGDTCDNSAFSNLNGDSGVDYNLYVHIGATCRGDSPIVSSNNRNVAVVYKLERAGQYCYNS
ncbi:type II secretion system protein [Candidatus Saccharibacteria bacterium]|nr:type II secretion system protein [Candidatus Saccharibacteria bacterium]